MDTAVFARPTRICGNDSKARTAQEMKRKTLPPNAVYRHRQTLYNVKTPRVFRGELGELDGTLGYARPLDAKGTWFLFFPVGTLSCDLEDTFRVRRCNVDWL